MARIRPLALAMLVANSALAQQSPANVVVVTVPVCVTPFSYAANTTQTALSRSTSAVSSAYPLASSGALSSASASAPSASATTDITVLCGQSYTNDGAAYTVACNSTLIGRVIEIPTTFYRREVPTAGSPLDYFNHCLQECNNIASCQAVSVAEGFCTLFGEVERAAAIAGGVVAYNARRFAGFVGASGSVTASLPSQTPTQASWSSSSASTATVYTTTSAIPSELTSYPPTTSSSIAHYSSTTFASSPPQEPTSVAESTTSQLMTSPTSTTSASSTALSSSSDLIISSTAAMMSSQAVSSTPRSETSSPAEPAHSTFSSRSATSAPAVPSTTAGHLPTTSSSPSPSSTAVISSPLSFSSPPVVLTEITEAQPSTTPEAHSTTVTEAQPTTTTTTRTTTPTTTTSSSKTSSSLLPPSPTSTVIPDCDNVPFISEPTLCNDTYDNTFYLENGKGYLGNIVGRSVNNPDIDACLVLCDKYPGCVAVNYGGGDQPGQCDLMTAVYGSQTPSGGSSMQAARRPAGYGTVNTAAPALGAAS